MPKFHLHHIEFYITNVCNLTCNHCRSFNNYKFKGHYEFDHATYQPWAHLLDLDSIDILGGEPTLHPRLESWLVGIRQLWPSTRINLSTNGTYLAQAKGLHELLARLDINVNLSIHSQHLRPVIADQIHRAFGDCKILPIEKNDTGDFINVITLETAKGVRIRCQSYTDFYPSAFRNDRFEFYNSDPDLAHAACKLSTCHHMVDGRLYKCAVTATAKEFLQQQGLAVPPLIDQYQPLSPSQIDQAALDALQRTIPQCRLCPEAVLPMKLKSSLKGKRVIKIFDDSMVAPQ